MVLDRRRGRIWDFESPWDWSETGAVPSGTFDPTTITGLIAWFHSSGPYWQDSARTTPATLDADPVGAWDDGSGLNHHLLQATAGKRPTLKLAVQHGLNAVRSDGVDDFLATAGYTQAQPLTLVCAIKPTWANAKYFWDAVDFPDRAAAFWEATNNGLFDPFAGTAVPTGLVTGVWSTINIVYNGASSLVRVNGGADSTVNLGALAQNGLTMFSRQTGLSNLSADMGRFLVYNGAKTLGERAQLDAYVGAYL